MTTKKLNDAPVLDQIDGQWQKMAMILLWKLAGTKQVKVTADDIKAMSDHFAPGISVVYVHGHSDSLEFQLVDEASANRLVLHEERMRGNA